MTLRKWFHLFWTTMLVGALLGIAAGLVLKLTDQNYTILGLSAVGLNLLYMALIGATISIVSQMGYFSFMIVRYFGMGMIRNARTWDLLQWALIVITLFELVFLRAINSEGDWLPFVPLPIILLMVSLAVAYWKMNLTNAKGFLPTLFFMVVVTSLEAIPALRENNPFGTFFMVLPLLGCNAWQILILPKVLGNNKSEP
ncbi:KinB-signaling pathway activation protein [Paenibacillus chartarius]|uniref:KinB-signaling pathway activation protein n=1 Tax=Paenibacillus chartarius TaxID=747481 RepID=A0ABV6DJE8_9BACL